MGVEHLAVAGEDQRRANGCDYSVGNIGGNTGVVDAAGAQVEVGHAEVQVPHLPPHHPLEPHDPVPLRRYLELVNLLIPRTRRGDGGRADTGGIDAESL